MGNKERVLEVLKANREGLTFVEIDKECKIGHDLYAYLSRLGDDGLVEIFRTKNGMRKVVGFRATEKAWEEERKEEALENLKILYNIMNKKMSPDMELNADEEKALELIERGIR